MTLIGLCAPGAGPLAPAVMGYGLCLSTMAVLATGLGRGASLGGALFLVSDALIALDAFYSGWALPHQDLVVMSTYIAAQLLLVGGVAGSAGANRGAGPAQPPT